MDGEERRQAIFGSFDGVVSVVGFVFGLLVHHARPGLIAVGGLGGAITATVSMSTGTFQSMAGSWRARMPATGAMAASTLIGSLVPVWPYFVFGAAAGTLAGMIGCLLVATWIGWQKARSDDPRHAGTLRHFAGSYATFAAAAGFCVAIIAAIPASGG